MTSQELRQRRRSDYVYFLAYRTRWSDNDQYSHMNNSVYFHLFDSIINAYLIEKCGLEPSKSDQIGLVVSSYCEFYEPAAFPETLDLGLYVKRMGNSSVTYEVGVFRKGSDKPAAVGGYTHVFVGRTSRKSTTMGDQLRRGLQKLFTSGDVLSKL